MQAAHAGTYDPPVQGGLNPGASTNLTVDVSPPGRGSASNSVHKTDPDQPNSYRVDRRTYSWTWTPNGMPQNDPAPTQDVILTYAMSGGPLEGGTTGNAEVYGAASLFCDLDSNSVAWSADVDSTRPATWGMPMSVSPPTGTVVVKFVNRTHVVGNTLTFDHATAARSGCDVTTFTGGQAHCYVTNLKIRATSVSLQKP